MSDSPSGRWLGYPNVRAALLGGEDMAAFAADGLVCPAFLSPVIDFLVLGTVVQLHPAISGYICLGGRIQAIWATGAAGTMSVQGQAKIGNNGSSRDNVLAAGGLPLNGSAPTLARPASGVISIPAGTVGKAQIDLATPMSLEVTQAAAGSGLVAPVKILTVLCLLRVADL